MMRNGTRILIVDDELDVRQAIADRLEHLGFDVVQASDGLRALAELHQRRADVVVSDCNMPHLSGFDLLRQCRLAWPDMPVILLSAALNARDEVAASIGAFACLRKPFNAERLIALVYQAAGLPRPSSPPSSE